MTDHDVRTLLVRAADAAGRFEPPPAAALRRTAQRRSRLRVITAAGCAVLAVLGLSVALAIRGGSTSTSHHFDPDSLPGPTGGVSAATLATYRWSSLPRAPIAARTDAAAVWTGSQLLVWGGTTWGENSSTDQPLADGASYDPRTREWAVLPAAPLSARSDPAYAWVDGSFVVWGGSLDQKGHQADDGARYDPSTHSWTKLARAPISAYSTVQAFAIGSRVIFLSSNGSLGSSTTVHVDVYDVRTNSWSRLPSVPLPLQHAFVYLTGLVVGDDLFIWIGWQHETPDTGNSIAINAGFDSFVLESVSNRWSPVTLAPDQGWSVGLPVWTGRQFLLAGQGIYCGICSSPYAPATKMSAIDPRSGARTSRETEPTYASNGLLVWTGAALFAMSDNGYGTGASAAYDPTSDTWTRLPNAGWVGTGVTVWAGDRLLTWGVLSAGNTTVPGGLQFGPP